MNKHTQGKWTYQADYLGDCFYIESKQQGDIVAVVRNDLDNNEPEANAKLIAEAGTVTNETGYTPRQLADQVSELLQAATKLSEGISSGNPHLLSEGNLELKTLINKYK